MDGGERWAEIGQYYVSLNESVIGRKHFAVKSSLPKPCVSAPQNYGSAIKGTCRRGRPGQSWQLDKRRRRMSFGPGETEPSKSRGGEYPAGMPHAPVNQVTFSRRELDRILDLYGRKVAAGEWRDYAIDFLKDRAVFSVFRRSSEVPIYRIEKNPRLARKQGAYSVISATGLIVRRGQELDRVLRALDKSLSVVAV
jgi:hypothetical protein